jgi:ribulose-phosphate 3-epimerase
MPDLRELRTDRPLIAPSILSADFARMGQDCQGVLNTLSGGEAGPDGADLLHLDVMDGHFVPNLTMGPDLCRALRKTFPKALVDVHLMVTNPERFIEPFRAAGADHLTFHVEVAPVADLIVLAKRIRALGATAGVAINPPTPMERLVPVLEHVDLALVMSVNPGFSGQKFIEPVLEKTRAIAAWRKARASPIRIQMDGGLGLATIQLVLEAGCEVIVAASAIFGVAARNRLEVIRSLRGSTS